MLNLKVVAIRNNEKIEVTLTGELPDLCHRAIINGFYPHGGFVHITDPGEAEIYISEWSLKDVECPAVLIPWNMTLTIPDKQHDKVAIFINNEKIDSVEVLKDGLFCVYELTGGFVPPMGTYFIAPEIINLPSVFTKYFGPDTYQTCEDWILQHSGKPYKGFLAGGGGSGSPRGFF